MTQTVNGGTTSTRKGPSAGQIEKAKAVSTPPKQPVNDEEIRIIVMGRSGAGKSSFINLASNSRLRVGSSLESCTESVELSEPFELQGRRIRLIDTPGFDDSSKSDAEVLSTIANFLANEYRNGRKLSGLIYFHRISDVRMGAISKRNFVMFQKLCGSAALANVVLATTRWSEVKQAVGEGRETELRTKVAFFKPVIDAGAPLVRYMRTPESAMEILNHLVGKPAIPLLIQKEMVDGGKRLSETEAGQALQSEIAEQVRRHEEDMRTLLEELEDIKQGNDEGTQELDAEVKELREKVLRLKEETQKISSAQLPSATSNVIPGKDIVETPRPPSRDTSTGPPRRPSTKSIGSPSSKHVNSSIPRPPSRNATTTPTKPAGVGSIVSSNTPSSAPIDPSANVRRSPSKNVPASVNPSSHAPPFVPRPPSRNANTAASVIPSSNPAPSVALSRSPSKNVPATVNPSSHAPPFIPRPPSRNANAVTSVIHSSNPAPSVPPSRSSSKNVPASVDPSSHAPPSVPRPPSRNAKTATSVIPISNPAPSIPPLPNPSSSLSRAPSRKAPPSNPRPPPRQESYSTTNYHINNAPSSVAIPLERKIAPSIIAPSKSSKPTPLVATPIVPLQDVTVASSIAGSLPRAAPVRAATMGAGASTNPPARRGPRRPQRSRTDGPQRTQAHGVGDVPEEGILGRYFARAIEVGVIAAVTDAWEGLTKWWSA